MSFLFVAQLAGMALASLFLLVLYVYWNDRPLVTVPNEFPQIRVTPADVRAAAERLASSPPVALKEVIPPRTGRRCIVVGGGGFLGGWIAMKLLERGEEFSNIRLIDITPPSNHYVLKDALQKGLQFFKVDVTDMEALEAAFKAPWKSPSSELTVFHTAANIRFYERHEDLFYRSARVNLGGTQNVIDACRAVNASVLIFTSSGSVAVRSTRFLRWPWEARPKHFVQVINDDDNILPTKHRDFFSNYAVTKIAAERLVRAADRKLTLSGGILRTGCIRPGNGIFGSRGDMFCGAFLMRKKNISFIHEVVQSFSYVENTAVAHLCYEARLIELINGSNNPDIGGQAFCTTDPGPAPSYGDAYTTLTTLTDGECHFSRMSPTAMILLSHVVETYHVGLYRLSTSTFAPLRALGRVLPPITGDIINMQPSLFNLMQVHLIFDDSRARLPPEKGGLGYEGAWTTMEGLHKLVDEHKSGIGRSDTRSASAGVSFGFRMLRGKERGGVELVAASGSPIIIKPLYPKLGKS